MNRHHARLWPLAVIVLLAGGCAASPQKAIFDTDESQLQLRSYQARTFEASSELDVMRDVIDTLQDLGFVLEMTVTIRPRGDDTVQVRANAQRGRERIDDPEVYQEFFNALQQSVFITAGAVR